MDAPPPRAPWALKLPAGLRASVEVPDGQFLHLQEARLVLPCGSDELDQAVALRGVRVVAAVAERQYELVQLRPPRWFARPQEQGGLHDFAPEQGVLSTDSQAKLSMAAELIFGSGVAFSCTSQRLGALGSGSFSSCDVDGTAASEDGGGGAEDGVAVLLLGYFQSMELEGLPKHGGRLLLHHAPSA